MHAPCDEIKLLPKNLAAFKKRGNVVSKYIEY
jgi:hypothetical protein